MYPEVKGEMRKKNITLAMIVDDPRIDCTISTMSQKLNGKYPLHFDEAVAIKDILHSEMPLEVLFREVAE